MAVTGKGRGYLSGWRNKLWGDPLEGTAHVVRKTTQFPPKDAGHTVWADWFFEAGGGPTPITGTGAVTQAAQTADGTGSYTPLAITGTGACSQAAETASGSGTVVTNLTGSGAVTQAAQEAAGTATETFSGSGDVTQAAQTASGSGTETFSGSGAVTQAAQTAAGTGENVLGVTGTGACTQAAQTADGSGNQYTPTGVGDCTQAAQTIEAAGYQEFIGAGSVAHAAQLVDGSGWQGVDFTGTGDCTQAAQTCEGTDAELARGVWGDGPRPKKHKLKGPKWQEVYKQYAKGELHSGRVDGPVVVKAKQARAIAYSVEKKTLKPILDDDEQDNPFNKQR